MASILAMWSGGGYIESFPNAALKFSPVDNKTLKKLNILIDRTLLFQEDFSFFFSSVYSW